MRVTTAGVVFNESEVLAARAPTDPCSSADTSQKLWYSDEHAMLLGVDKVVTKTSSGTTTTFPPGGDKTASDAYGRPLRPSLSITDITFTPNDRSGDWQNGGTPIDPNNVFGATKNATRTIDNTNGTDTIAMDADPAANGQNLGAGSDPIRQTPATTGTGPEAAGTSAWPCTLGPGGVHQALQSGHVYRVQFMVHDGDQNKTGGDVGQACTNIRVP